MPRASLSKRLFAFHGWLGLTFGLPLFVICFSGALAVFSPEIDRLIHPEMRVRPPADPEARPLPWDLLAARVAEASPGGEITRISRSDDPRTAWEATVSYSPRDHRLVHLDPFTGVVQGQRTTFTARSFFRIFHKQFYILEGPLWPHGRVVVCAFATVLLLSSITGLMLHRGWWKHLFRLRASRGGRVFASDLHRFAGVWSLLLGILFAVTGMWFLAERLMEDAGIRVHDPGPGIAPATLASRPPVLERLPLDTLLAGARDAYPGFEPTAVAFPRGAGDPVTIHGHGTAALADSDRVHLDPYDGRVLHADKAHESGVGGRLESLARPLHFGRFGGWLTKLVWTAAGLLLSLGILAGAAIWWLRSRRVGGGSFKRPARWSLFSLVLNLGILLLAGFSTLVFIRAQVDGPRTTAPSEPLGRAEIGPWTLAAYRDGAQVTFRFHCSGDANHRAAFAWRGGPGRPAGLEPMRGGLRTLTANLPGPNTAPLRIEIESWDGAVHSGVVTRDPGWLSAIVPPEAPAVPQSLKVVVAVFFGLLALPVCWWMARIR